jgi:hypothetical protein
MQWYDGALPGTIAKTVGDFLEFQNRTIEEALLTDRRVARNLARNTPD